MNVKHANATSLAMDTRFVQPQIRAILDPATRAHVVQTANLSKAHHTLLLAAALCSFLVAITFAILWKTKATAQYGAHFEMLPADPALILDCPGDPQAFWPQTGLPTTQCIFSGNAALPSGTAVTEAEVQARCNARTDCAGYSKRRVSSYVTSYATGDSTTHCTTGAPQTDTEGKTTCSPSTPVTTTGAALLDRPYNWGQDEYMLLPVAALANLVPIPAVSQGNMHQIQTVTMQRLG